MQGLWRIPHIHRYEPTPHSDMPPMTPEELATQAIAGDRDALNALVATLQDDIYGLALRMLWHREDAEDATQEILLRIVHRLPQFGFRSRVRTWAYRVAFNYLLDFKKSAIERRGLTFEQFGEDLGQHFESVSADEVVESLLIDEVKVGCSLAMLQCLDRSHRAVYLLGEILEFAGPDGAEVLEISPALFRKRLQHARAAVVTFMRSHCGLVSDAAPCRCHRRVPVAHTAHGAPQPLRYARRETSFQEARAMVRRVEEARWALEVHRTSAPASTPADFVQRLLHAIDPEPGPAPSPTG